MRAYIGVGSNVGDRWLHLARAARRVRALPGVALLRASRVYDTAPVGPVPQSRFLNAVLELETTCVPERLLRMLRDVEAAAFRVRRVRWGPRALDLDLLLYDDRVLRAPELTIPHPGTASRRFVLEPLAELCPAREVPGTGRTVAELLAAAPPSDVVPVGRYPA